MQPDQGDQGRHPVDLIEDLIGERADNDIDAVEILLDVCRFWPCMASTAAMPRSRLIWAFIPSSRCCSTSADPSFVASSAVFQEVVCGSARPPFSNASR